MKTKSTILLFLFFVGFAFSNLSAQYEYTYSEHDVEKVKAFLRQGDNLGELGINPSDTLNWDTDYSSVRNCHTFDWNDFDGIWHLTGVEFKYATCGCTTPPDISGFLDLEGCQNLKIIRLMDSKIEGLDVSNCPKLETLYLAYSSLRQINLDNCPSLKEIDISYNQLDFNNLPRKEDLEKFDYYSFLPQNPKKIREAHMINVAYEFDDLGGTNFRWIDSEGRLLQEREDYIIEDGMITFLKETESQIRFEATNSAYPTITMTSDYTAVTTKELIEYNVHDLQKVKAFTEKTLNSYYFGIITHISGEWTVETQNIDWVIVNSTYRLGGISYFDEPFYMAPIHDGFDFEGCNELQYITLSNGGSDEINVSRCSKLKKIHISDGGSNKLLLSGCSELTSLKMEYTKEIIDLAHCTKLKEISLSGNIDEIDLSNNTQLASIDLSKTKLKKLILPECPKLTYLNISESTIAELDIEKCKNLTNLYCGNSSLLFSHLPTPKSLPFIDRYTYSPQSKIDISNISTSKIDLNYTGGTSFEWTVHNGIVLKEGPDYSIEEGVTTFHRALSNVYCKITNPDFPNLTLETTAISTTTHSIESSTLSGAVKAYSDRIEELILVAPVDAKYAVYNLSGNTVAKGTIAETEEAIDTPSGIYIVKIETDKGNVNRKVIVK